MEVMANHHLSTLDLDVSASADLPNIAAAFGLRMDLAWRGAPGNGGCWLSSTFGIAPILARPPRSCRPIT